MLIEAAHSGTPSRMGRMGQVFEELRGNGFSSLGLSVSTVWNCHSLPHAFSPNPSLHQSCPQSWGRHQGQLGWGN